MLTDCVLHRMPPLRIEFEELYTALFKHADKYVSVVKALSQHKEGMTRNDMMKALKIEGRNLTAVLRNLERCDFIVKMARFPNKSTAGEHRWRRGVSTYRLQGVCYKHIGDYPYFV